MHNNYYFLKQLSKAIADKLQVNWQWGDFQSDTVSFTSPMRLLTCFSQEKDELVLGFCNDTEEFYIKAVLNPSLSVLTFPTEFHRAKKNSVDLLKELIDLKATKVQQYLNERCFAVFFENNYCLLFKMHGRRSNVILFQENRFVIAFHKKMYQDKSLDIQHLDRIIEQNFEAFEKEKGDWTNLFPTFGQDIHQYLKEKIGQNDNITEKWKCLQELFKVLENPRFYIFEQNRIPQLTLLPLPNNPSFEDISYYLQRNVFVPPLGVRGLPNPLEASNEFYYAYSKVTLLQKEKAEIVKELLKKQKQSQNYLDKNKEKLDEFLHTSYHEETANLIMANLHQIPEGLPEVELFDFYQDKNRKIKLKKDLSPQKNAELYYRKAKNEKIEKEVLQKTLERKEKELKNLQKHLGTIEKIEELKTLRQYLRENQLNKTDKAEAVKDHLFRKFAYQGFEIWVGKNAKNNDLLTQKYAYKEDLWLHAKDVSGSHVIIKHQAGKKFPSDVIEKAASLAAYYSKRSRDSLCPVVYTPKKFVRKTKDLADGQVIVEKEQVMMVVPEAFE